MLYSDHREPFWATAPCDTPLAKYWICKKPVLGGINSSPRVKDVWCATGATFVGHNKCARYHSHRIDRILGVINSSILVFNTLIEEKFMWLANHTKEAYLTLSLASSIAKPKCVLYHLNATGGFTCKSPKSNTILCPMFTNINFFVDDPMNTLDTCHPGHTKCLDNTCVLDTLVCMHAGCNPGLCSCTLRSTGRKVTDVVFCAHHCTPLVCSCGPLFFQCSSGGCISLSKFMNGVHDCMDASDEIHPLQTESQNTLDARYDEVKNNTKFFSCNNGDILPLHYVDDLIPDCPGDDSEDEPIYWSLMENVNIRPSPCLEKGLIPCLQGHVKCLRFDQLCVYDLDGYSQIKYCRDGSHLQGCSMETCTNTYKCKASYCIPYHRVCDGHVDCPQRDDEALCSAYKCAGMLRCYGSFQCVHPVEICDGQMHCPHGDDEELCDIKPCPEGCQCLAHAVWCHEGNQPYIPIITTQTTVSIAVNRRNLTRLDIRNITSVSKLKILDIARNRMTKICLYLRKSQLFYQSIVIFDSSKNSIYSLSKNCFLTMPRLVTLDLHDNPLQHLQELALYGLENLQILNLMNTQLLDIHASEIYGTTSLVWLNIIGCPLRYLDASAIQAISVIDQVIFDNFHLCCAAPGIIQCRDFSIKRCLRLLEYSGFTYIIASLAISAMVLNIIALVYQQMKILTISPVIMELNVITLVSNMIQAFCILSLCFVDIFYGMSFSLSKSHWRNSMGNSSLGILYFSATSVSLILPNINVYILYRLSTSLTWQLREFSSKLRVWLLSHVVVTVVVSIMLAADDMIHAEEKSDFGIPFAKMNYTSIGDQLAGFGFIILDTTSLLLLMLLSVLMIRHIKKTERNVTCMVDEHENTSNAIRNMHKQRERNIKKRVMIILLTKLISWLPTSCTILSIYMNAKPPRPLMITIFCLLMPISMFLSPILVISIKRPVGRK